MHCGASLAVAMLEVVRGNLPEKIFFLKPRGYTLGRGRHNDLTLSEPSVSKNHARLAWEAGTFRIEDQGSLHGIYVNAVKVPQAELTQGTQVQLGNITLTFTVLGGDGATERIAELPWVEQQQLLLSVVETLNSSLVLSEVLDQVLESVMHITRAERGFLLLAGGGAGPEDGASVAGLRVRVGRGRRGPLPSREFQGISKSVVRKAIEGGDTVATGNAAADPSFGSAESVVTMDLRTIVCIPLFATRPVPGKGEGRAVLGAIYVDNQYTSAPFSAESLRTAEALGRHAAMAIENAQLFEREQDTIRELRAAQKQILQSEKLATIGQMAAGIAHELNTPLTYVMGNLELLQARPLSESQVELVRSIQKGAERIKSLGQSLLAFSRPSEEDLVPLAPNDLIERSLEMCRYQINQGGVRLRRELGPGLPLVKGLSSQLEMALINLFVNAVHAMSQGGELTVASALREGQVEITVSDTGTGIPESVRERLFEPFVTTKPEGQGTGLGLSTVLMVAERHGGTIDYTTQPGRGTSFRLRLPAATGTA
jgi:signal transduction histidine kinase